MTYSSYKSRVSPLYKNLYLLKINDIYILEICTGVEYLLISIICLLL